MICPHCSLLCEAPRLESIECSRRERALVRIARAQHFVQTASSQGAQKAFDRSVALLRGASQVLITGRITSVQTARAAVKLARQSNAVIDCAENGHAFHNIAAIQRVGFNGVSLGEAREHSNLILVIGDDRMLEAYPRLPQALSSDRRKSILLMGGWSAESRERWRDSAFDVWSVQCDLESIPKSLAQSSLTANEPAETAIAQMLQESSYTTVLWSSALLGPSQTKHTDLWVESLLHWIAQQNSERRCAALAWAGLDATFHQVCTWLTGFPGRIRFRNGEPEYAPSTHSYSEWIERFADYGNWSDLSWNGRLAHDSSEIRPLVIRIDETTMSESGATFGLGKYTGPLIDIRALDASTTDGADAKSPGEVVTLACSVAGTGPSVDMFRGDQCVLAHIASSPQSDEREKNASVQSASDWLERMLGQC